MSDTVARSRQLTWMFSSGARSELGLTGDSVSRYPTQSYELSRVVTIATCTDLELTRREISYVSDCD